MGFFQGLGRRLQGAFDPSNIASAQAALAGDYGAMAQIGHQRRRERQEQDEAEAQRRIRAQQIEAAAQMRGPNGRPMFTKSQLNAMNADDLSAAVRDASQNRQFGSEGGSVGAYNAETGQMEFTNAPRSYSDEGRLYQIDPQGNPNQVLDARENDVRWQTGDWGAFATDRSGRPLPPGSNIQSQMGQGQPQMPQPGQPQLPQQPGASPTAGNGDDVFGRMIQRESQGQQFAANGSPLRSSAGAIGIAQVMPGTGPEAAALAGLPWEPQRLRNDPQYNAALGRAYFQKQLQDFGDPVLAAAAYNAGPQRVRNALQRGGQNWQQFVPRETRDYVQAVFGGAQGGGQQMAQAAAPNVQAQAGTGMVNAGNRPPPGYQWQQDGALAPIPGGPGDRSRESRQDTGQVIQQYRSDPIVQQWQAARVATMQLQNLGQSGSPADDVAMIFSFMRALDPNSTVREGEFATAQNTAGIPERVRNYYNQAARGTLLGEQQRREFVNTAGRLYTERSRVYNEHADSYRRQLRSMGVENPNEFVPVAMAPVTADRQRRERQSQPVNPQEVVGAVQGAIEQMIPGQPQRFRILRRRRR